MKTTKKEMREMQRKIDQGIRLAQSRLANRARTNQQPLVVCRNGEVVELIPEEIVIVNNPSNAASDCHCGDPLRKKEK